MYTANQFPITPLFDDLMAHFVHEPHWWPIYGHDVAFETTVGMVLVQQTRWEVVEAAVIRLRNAGIQSFADLANADADIVATLCKPCAFYTRKGQALVALAQQICAYQGGMAAILAQPRMLARNTLLSLPQIGRESADTILLYAGHHPLFIVDAYARRFLSRTGILQTSMDVVRAPYDEVQALVEAQYPLRDAATAREVHAMMVEVCIHHCTANRPRCMQPGYHRTFVDKRKCAAHCVSCQHCPAVSVCAHHDNIKD